MSTIKIKGYASRKAVADSIKYNISFISKDMKTSRASEQVRKQCDIFLKNMKENGFDISIFHLDNDHVEKKYNENEKTACRLISFEILFDSKINNLIYTIIKKEDLNVEVSTEFSLSNEKKIHEELLKEAFLDSKNRAEIIASANNQKVKYAELITDNKNDFDYDEKIDYENFKSGYVKGILFDDNSLSAELSAKQIKEYAELYVTWVIE